MCRDIPCRVAHENYKTLRVAGHGDGTSLLHRLVFPGMQKDGIAIIGVGCRFPGGVTDADSFWKLLIEGRDAVTDVPADRWSVERFYDPEQGIPGKTFAKRGGF